MVVLSLILILQKSIIQNSFDELKKTDLIPFKLLKNEKMVMLAHIIYKSIDDEVATFSKVITKDVLKDNVFQRTNFI